MNEEKALMDFLLDIQCLFPLTEWNRKFNLFDVLKISTMEIRHSNLLAWLLTPNENHGLGNSVLQRLLQKTTERPGTKWGNTFKAPLIDLDSFVIFREYKHIDILAVSKKEKFLLCIENKVFSKEHDHQLSRYYSLLENEYHGYMKVFVYLTPYGDLPEEEEMQKNWQTLNYQEVMEIITSVLEKRTLAPDVKMVIDHYMDAVRRQIMGDMKLEELCREIYAKHKNALDLIFEYRNDTAAQTAEIIRTWCEQKANAGEIIFRKDAATKGEIPFTTEAMNKKLPPFTEQESYWGDKSMYRYAFISRDNGQTLSLKLFVNRKKVQFTRDYTG